MMMKVFKHKTIGLYLCMTNIEGEIYLDLVKEIIPECILVNFPLADILECENCVDYKGNVIELQVTDFDDIEVEINIK